MNPLLDEGLDELAAQSHQSLAARAVVTFGVGLISLTLLPLSVALTWTLAALALEGWSWFATRGQFLARPVTQPMRLNHFLNLVAISGAWFTIGALFWLTGRSDGALCAVIVWLSLIAYGQAFAFQSPIGYVVSGGLPAAGMLLLTLTVRSGPGAPLTPVWTMLLIAVAFAGAGFSQMLTSRRRFMSAQENLRQSEASYRILADNVTDVITRHSHDRRLVYVSPSAERLFGYTPAELLTSVRDYIVPEDLPLLAAAIGAVRETASHQTAQYRILHRSGAVIWVESSIAPLGADSGDVVAVTRDITARKKLEDDLVAAVRRAEAAAASKADFLANMTHELRTPLTAIIGFSEVLKRSSGLSAPDTRHVGLIHDASGTLLAVVNSVLDYSKLEAGGLDFEREPFDPQAMARSLVAIVREQAEAKGLNLTLRGTGATPIGLLGDGPRIGQVLLNFLSNAIKFTSEGAVEVIVDQAESAIGRRLRIEVRDSGPGVSEDKLDMLFERFTQADATVSRRFGGTGLGLAIARRIVEGMGGSVGASSVPGQGSCFWCDIDLPVADLATSFAAAGPAEPLDQAIRLLLVEDNPTNRELIVALLAPFDVDITIARDGAEGVEAVRAERFDVVLMDVQMPVMDGLTATREIRRLAIAQPPIIAMTANVLPEQIARCLEAGMNDHIGKPLSAASLIDRLMRWTQPAAPADETDQRTG